jgi:ubiquinone/menaquinone biosynthesis C-methylase UbiE
MGRTLPVRMASGTSPFVDYQAVAERYAVERAVDAPVLARWRRAAFSYLRHRPAVVADVGCGTGIFARAWAEWAYAQVRVVGVEPAPAMLRAAAAAPRTNVSYLRGVAEALPLEDRSVDVAWVSTAFHHFASRRSAAREMARVLRTGGRVFLRGVVRDLTPVPWLDAFPGGDKSLARYPTLEQLEAVFDDAGLALLGTQEVEESPRTNGDRAEWVRRMRDADSLLTAMTDDEVAVGVRTLRRRPDEVVPVSLTLVVFSGDVR